MEIENNENKSNIFSIKSSDGVEFQVNTGIANMSVFIATFVKENPNSSILHLENIKSNDLRIIIQFCEHHKYIPPPEIVRPLQYNELSKCVSDIWDAEFISSIEFEKVTELLLVADYLGISSLTDLCYARMAMYFRGKF
jgi:S-phase kinase-associated protein 1